MTVLPDSQDGSANAPLYFTIVVHIEPSEQRNNPDYYEMDKGRLSRLVELVASHPGRMWILLC
jgi:hypothetical protein